MSREVSSARESRPLSAAARPVGGGRFDAIMAILSAWIVVGLYIDGWSHRRFPSLESFFTPWHALFYSGYLSMAVFTGVTILQSARRGLPWGQALPLGYGKTAVGLVVFGAGGVADIVWHELFGLEKNVEAVVSPSHLPIFIGLALIVSGPLRAAWHRWDGGAHLSLRHHFPLLLSVALLWSVFTFVTQIMSPFVNKYADSTSWSYMLSLGGPAPELIQIVGVSSIVVQTAILMGLLLLIVGRWQLPFGSLTLVFSSNLALVSLLGDQPFLVLVAILAGLGADLLLWLLQPSATRIGAYRLFASAVPLLVYAAYFLSVKAREGLGWSIQMVAGGIVFAGLTGLLVSYLVLPPSGGGPDPLGGGMNHWLRRSKQGSPEVEP